MSNINNKLVEVSIDRSFHHCSLITSDVEWSSIQNISCFAPYVYIGNFQNALNEQELKDKNIKIVLAVTKSDKDPETKKLYQKLGIIHQFISLEDICKPNEGENTLKDVCDMGYNLISKCITQKINILVHDNQGVSAGPAIVVIIVSGSPI